MARTDANEFMDREFPELRGLKRTVSRMWERKYDRKYLDDWWFKFGYEDLTDNEFIVFVGANDYSDIDLKVFKVPARYILENIDTHDEEGMDSFHVHIRTFRDIRCPNGVSFEQFALN